MICSSLFRLSFLPLFHYIYTYILHPISPDFIRLAASLGARRGEIDCRSFKNLSCLLRRRRRRGACRLYFSRSSGDILLLAWASVWCRKNRFFIVQTEGYSFLTDSRGSCLSQETRATLASSFSTMNFGECKFWAPSGKSPAFSLQLGRESYVLVVDVNCGEVVVCFRAN